MFSPCMMPVCGQFECCGVNNYTDWSGKGTVPERQVPPSCCISGDSCAANPTLATVYPTVSVSEAGLSQLGNHTLL